MQDSETALLTQLLAGPVASLATLHQNNPAVSMAPFAIMPNTDVIIHVSSLASHTQDMLACAKVALLITSPLGPDQSPLALPRLALNGTATPLPVSAEGYQQARDVYLARFADAQELFSFADFSLFKIVLTSARFVAGFGRARTLKPEQILDIMAKNTHT
jgi:heme iron utilization protein